MPRCGRVTVIGSASCMRVTPISALSPNLLFEAGKRRGEALETLLVGVEDGTKAEDQRGVDEVLAGGAEMDVLARRRAERTRAAGARSPGR